MYFTPTMISQAEARYGRPAVLRLNYPAPQAHFDFIRSTQKQGLAREGLEELGVAAIPNRYLLRVRVDFVWMRQGLWEMGSTGRLYRAHLGDVVWR